MALQHEKIREYLPPAEGDRLFEDPEAGSSPPRAGDPANDSTTTIDEPFGTCLDDNEKPILVCYICAKGHRSKSDLRQHIFCHLKQEVMNKYFGKDTIVK